MTAPVSEQANDRIFCWEQVSRTNGLFRVSRVFAPRDCAGKLLPIYALFSVIEQICSSQTDVEVAARKLSWWRNECLHQDLAVSQHPIVRELVRTGTADSLPGAAIAALFDGADRRLSATAPTDLDGLRSKCIEIYRPQLEIELSVSESPVAADNFNSGLLARNGLFQILRESSRGKGQGSFWWVPHNALARHRVSREEISRNPQFPAVAGLLKSLITSGLSWGRDLDHSLEMTTIDFSPARHVFAISGLYARKLQGLLEIAPDRFAVEMGRLNPVDLFAAWKYARRPG
jgi:phytoene/squalene synthetase